MWRVRWRPVARRDEAAESKKDAELLTLKRDLGLAAVLALPLLVVEMGSHLIPGLHEWVMSTLGLSLSWQLQFVLASLVLAIPGRRFYLKGLPALLRLAPDMNSLVAVGTAAAYGYSVVATFAPGLLPAGTVNVYYEAAAVIVALILLGPLSGGPGQGPHLRGHHAPGGLAGPGGPRLARWPPSGHSAG